MGHHALPRALPGEAGALSCEDIDFDSGVVHVGKGRKRIGGWITIGTTKTPGSVRSLDSPTVITDALRTTRRDQRLQRIAAGDRSRSEDDLVFTNVVGSPADPPKVRAEFNRIRRREGLSSPRRPDQQPPVNSEAGATVERTDSQHRARSVGLSQGCQSP